MIYNVANFAKPAPGQPALLSFDDVTTMFHEFGHALHGLFANQRYPTLSGTAVARDFVEFPSQFNEHWALDPKVFAHYARHYQTGAAMPQALVDKIKKAAKFNQGYALTELLAAADLDMAWHTLPPGAGAQDSDTFEAAALARISICRRCRRATAPATSCTSGRTATPRATTRICGPRCSTTTRLRGSTEHGGLTRANGQRFRDLILSQGNTEDYAKMFRDFRGRDPDVNPMLVQRGLGGGSFWGISAGRFRGGASGSSRAPGAQDCQSPPEI